MTQIQLGDKVKDSVTGFMGIAVGKTTWLHGCDRITVQPEGVNKEGKTYDPQSFDAPQLIIVKAAKVAEGDHKKGGPNVEVRQKITPSRF